MNKIDVIEKSRGRFCGITTKSGEKLNARYVGSSNSFIRVFDRNAQENRKFAKASIKEVSYGGETFRR